MNKHEEYYTYSNSSGEQGTIAVPCAWMVSTDNKIIRPDDSGSNVNVPFVYTDHSCPIDDRNYEEISQYFTVTKADLNKLTNQIEQLKDKIKKLEKIQKVIVKRIGNKNYNAILRGIK